MSEEEALEEIVQQLLTRGDNKVWIDDWRQRYAALSPTPKEFMLRHPDKFTLNFTGNRFTVTLVQGQGQPKPPRTFPMKKPTPITPRPQAGYGWGFQPKGWGKGFGSAWGKGGAAAMALPAPRGSDADAVQEIKRQLETRPDGYVWIPNWYERFGFLAPTQKFFLESRPDLFFLTWEGKRYTVSYVGPEQFSFGPRGAGKRPLDHGAGLPFQPPTKVARMADTLTEGTIEEAVELMAQQLSSPTNTQGKVWIDGWHKRFGHLGASPKEVMECYPETFEVTLITGNKFRARLVESAAA